MGSLMMKYPLAQQRDFKRATYVRSGEAQSSDHGNVADYDQEVKKMLDGHSVVVDQLVKIIQALQVGRTTGSLVATRGEGARYEVGTLVFVDGRVVQAKVGRRQDREALNWLSTWGRCKYTFVFSWGSKHGGGQQGPAEPVHEPVHKAIPYRSKPLDYGLRVIGERGLSRGHTHLFLLIDGRREPADFMRLLKLDEYEVLGMLYDLQDVGVITIPSPLSF